MASFSDQGHLMSVLLLSPDWRFSRVLSGFRVTSVGWFCFVLFCFVFFSCSVVSDSLQPHGLQYARLLGPSLSPDAGSNSCPLSQWCHWTISSSVAPFSSCLQSFPASGSFPVSQLFTSGGQNFGASASAWVLLMSIQGWFPLRLTGLLLMCLHSLDPATVEYSQYVSNHSFLEIDSNALGGSKTKTHLQMFLDHKEHRTQPLASDTSKEQSRMNCTQWSMRTFNFICSKDPDRWSACCYLAKCTSISSWCVYFPGLKLLSAISI